ncbi:type VI secretion system contractile sheath large subunit [Burkholderia ubonensis]|uniref:type VI secretion system contractile sheath large subunit n=1 Tax=Burkholderia ubonensis TaxID=101571 RepID=UPI0007596030|nr:type VI secretion system contractile sheath large subunit [Burkholderia ubonensis]KVX20857.1 EvpB family type VI secretion protein [Burkholderia ubonensis]KVZ96612.1 EvpB family type VI secretion protein [Burkholderia ubonensis]KWD56970.1 EvpB family type VI secretion protein [Burkholderia ubonensis]KWD63898.1 EvpB family type VI secretion protein [Burkholderia ubonensis]KWE31117.1 EvpB family type VI secretion protein [Burkholderia ubonensis]
MSAGFQSDQYTQTAAVSDTHARANSNAMTCMDPDLLDWCLADLDEQLGRQLDAILHHPAFQALESTWRGLQFLVDRTDFRQNAKIEVLDVSKEALHQDFEDTPDIIQSGLFRLTYVGEYDMPGGQPIAAIISAFEFDHRAQDIALLRNISKVAAAAHMPFIGAASPAFFDKPSMEAVAGIRDLPIWFERAEYLKWKGFRETDDARYVALTMPRFLARLPYGPDTLSVRTFNYTENVRDAGRSAYLWTSAAFAFAVNIVRSFVRNGWCVQIRGPHAGGLIDDIPVHRYDLGAGQLGKICTEALISETRENEFSDIGLIPLSYTSNHDQTCFFSAHSTQRPRTYDARDASANSRINARLPYIFLLSRIAHYLKLIQRENIGTTRDRRLLELELNNWIKSLVTEMTDPGDDLQAAHPLREAKVTVEDIEDNPGFFRIKLFIVPHFQIEGVDINLSLVSQMPKAKQ